MKASEIGIKVLGLTRADKMDLAALDERHQITFEESTAQSGRFGEPVTISVLLGLAALGVLAAWVVKTRIDSTTELTIETRDPKGATRKVRYKKHVTKETSEADVLKELTALIRGPE
jgi:hypothetical protein